MKTNDSRRILVSNPAVLEKIRFHQLTEEDLATIARWKHITELAIEDLITLFYDHILGTAETKRILEQHSSIARQRPLLKRYILTLLSPTIDEEYLHYRERVGISHDNIDLDSNWYIAMYQSIRQKVVSAVEKSAGQKEARAFERAFVKLVQVDIALVIKSLMDSRRGKIERVMNELVSETGRLVEHAQKGELHERARTERFTGETHRMLESFNRMLDAVVGPIDEAARVLRAASQRDLTSRMTGTYYGKFAEIHESTNEAMTALDRGLAQVAESALQISIGSDEIAQGSQDLAQNASTQAGALERVNASIGEMSQSAQKNSEQAKRARELAQNAKETADKGVQRMQTLSSLVNRIKESAQATEEIISTINSIAFQTNILALNAAIEGARAGEAGKAFSVVAGEVRTLAHRSAEAATHTSALLEEVRVNVDQGVLHNTEVLSLLTRIHEQVTQFSASMTEISEATESQRGNLGELTSRLQDLSEGTQRTSANSEESAATAEEFAGQAETLKQLVGSYRLSH